MAVLHLSHLMSFASPQMSTCTSLRGPSAGEMSLVPPQPMVLPVLWYLLLANPKFMGGTWPASGSGKYKYKYKYSQFKVRMYILSGGSLLPRAGGLGCWFYSLSKVGLSFSIPQLFSFCVAVLWSSLWAAASIAAQLMHTTQKLWCIFFDITNKLNMHQCKVKRKYYIIMYNE